MKHVKLAIGFTGVMLHACAGSSNSPGGAGQGGSTGYGTAATAETFCPVQALLESRCQTCHSDPPIAGVPMALLTYDDLVAPAVSDTSRSAVDVSIARMQDRVAPMPPAPDSPASAEEVALLQDWVSRGMPAACEDATLSTTDAYDTPLTCTSGAYSRGEEESSSMSPGGACISCHASSREGPRYALAGTVYPTAHEPDDCNGVNGSTSGAQIMVIDAAGATIVVEVNSVGNFYSRESFVAPYYAKVVQNDQERAMVSAQEDGDCNSCHTESGTNQAPGRIMLP